MQQETGRSRRERRTAGTAAGREGKQSARRRAANTHAARTQKNRAAGCTLQPDDSIRLGGLRAENRAAHMAADDTLSTRLAAQRSWFLENAGLSIEL